MVIISGCQTATPRVKPPKIDAVAAGKLAIVEFDADNNESLTPDELANVPALDLGRLDSDQNGSISADEITARIKKWQDSNVGMTTFDLRLKLNGKPLSGAMVKLEPLSFLGDAVLVAEGMTDKDGFAILSVAPSHRPYPNIEVLQCGFYRILVSKKTGDRETIPPRYNVNTELGIEVAPDFRNDNVILKLGSR